MDKNLIEGLKGMTIHILVEVDGLNTQDARAFVDIEKAKVAFEEYTGVPYKDYEEDGEVLNNSEYEQTAIFTASLE